MLFKDVHQTVKIELVEDTFNVGTNLETKYINLMPRRSQVNRARLESEIASTRIYPKKWTQVLWKTEINGEPQSRLKTLWGGGGGS